MTASGSTAAGWPRPRGSTAVLLYAALSSVWTARDPGPVRRARGGRCWSRRTWSSGSCGRSTSSRSWGWACGSLAPPRQLVCGPRRWCLRPRWSPRWLGHWLFYVPHRIGAATFALAVAAVLTWVLVALVAWSLPWAGVVPLVPYAVWLSVATALSVEYFRLN